MERTERERKGGRGTESNTQKEEEESELIEGEEEAPAGALEGQVGNVNQVDSGLDSYF